MHVADPPSSVDIRYSLDRIILTLEALQARALRDDGVHSELLGRIAPDLAGHLTRTRMPAVVVVEPFRRRAIAAELIAHAAQQQRHAPFGWQGEPRGHSSV